MNGLHAFPRRRSKLKAEINVVPYIDVMLVLMVVFMITAPVLMQGVEVELPEAASEPMAEEDNEPIIVSIKADGSYYTDIGGEADQPRSITEIAEVVGKVLDQKPEAPVLVWGDQAVPYGEVIGLMTVLQNAGATGVGLVTQPPTVE